jgi:hypothetical protein
VGECLLEDLHLLVNIVRHDIILIHRNDGLHHISLAIPLEPAWRKKVSWISVTLISDIEKKRRFYPFWHQYCLNISFKY